MEKTGGQERGQQEIRASERRGETLGDSHEDGVPLHHLGGHVEGEAVEAVHQVLVEDVQVLTLLHGRVEERRPVYRRG